MQWLAAAEMIRCKVTDDKKPGHQNDRDAYDVNSNINLHRWMHLVYRVML
jgi:hypothetical protein